MLCDLHKVGDPLEASAHHHLDASLVQEDLLQVEQGLITDFVFENLLRNTVAKGRYYIIIVSRD